MTLVWCAFFFSCFPPFRLSCFSDFLLSCFSNVRYWYTIVQSTLPAPGRDGLPNLPNVSFVFHDFSCFPACLLSCFSTFLLVCFAVLLLLFVSAFVFAFPCFLHVLLAVRCRLVLRIVLTLACSVRVQFSPYQPAVVQRRSGSSMASLDKASAAWLYSR